MCWTSAVFADSSRPAIHELSLRGLTSGKTTRLAIRGENLLTEPRVLMSVPITSQKVLAGAEPNVVEIELALPADITPGIYQLWVATEQGISPPVAVAVDALPNAPLTESVANLPAALSGTLDGNAVARTSFEGRAGDSIVIDAECARLASELRPVLHLYDARHVQVAWSQGNDRAFGDARIALELPADGRYTVELHDSLYRAQSPGHYRLKIGPLHYADLAFPLGIRVGDQAVLNFASTNFPAHTSVTAQLPGAGEQPAPWPQLEGLSGIPPRVIASTLNELVESPPDSGLQKLTPQTAVSGRIAKAGEEDRYQLAVTPGMKLRFDVLAHGIGSPLDSVLTLLGPDDKPLASNDDRPGNSDPELEFTVPEKVNSLVVSIQDVTAAGGPDYVYRVAIEEPPAPDFRLHVLSDDVALPSDGTAIVHVHADRQGYDGPIRLRLENAPQDVKLTGSEIPAGATDTLIGLALGTHEPQAMLTQVVGESTDPQHPLRHAATLAPREASLHQPWLQSEFALALTSPGALRVDWQTASADPRLPLGTELPIQVKLSRSAGREGKVRLSLLTTQVVPLKRVDKTPAISPTPVKGKYAPNLERALRFAEQPLTAADQSSTQAKIIVPGDLPNIPYDVAVQAELLSGDDQTVLATAVSPVKRLQVSFPFTVAANENQTIEARAGLGETGSIRGTIDRHGDFSHPVTVSLTGLPPELPIPTVDLDATATEFTLPVSFPYQTPIGPLKNVRLTAVSPINPDVPLRVNQVPVSIDVVAGNPPPNLYRVFEDEAIFPQYLDEGNGKAMLETDDVYSGTAALKIVTPYRGRARLPGLGIKIREKPGDGEYRYLRYAWKAPEGAVVLMQFNVNGGETWQPDQNMPPYAYELGDGGNAARIAALRLGNKPPRDWTIVTRDLYGDFGEFTLDGMSLFPDTERDSTLLVDHFYLAKSEKDFADCPPPRADKKAAKK